ncbi:hypothetical protein K7X08_028196 [Anisodus acutangulus]|uniref:Uncharacterized protein n=1 Tax=Anisodus acutangulus TaxID=402998 RepID=A0A9Q1RNB7_9SOLA|nr:hypothetical protein K7X08_028196 [Anisodus acutangulus]
MHHRQPCKETDQRKAKGKDAGSASTSATKGQQGRGFLIGQPPIINWPTGTTGAQTGSNQSSSNEILLADALGETEFGPVVVQFKEKGGFEGQLENPNITMLGTGFGIRKTTGTLARPNTTVLDAGVGKVAVQQASGSNGKVPGTEVGVQANVAAAPAKDMNVKEGGTTEPTWASISSGKRLIAKGMMLNFEPPTIVEGEKVVVLNKEELEKENATWSAAVIFMLLVRPTIGAIERFLRSNWNFIVNLKFLPY